MASRRNQSQTKVRDRNIKEGDRNTAYFHAVANQRRRKTLIHSLDGPNGPVTEVDEMLKGLVTSTNTYLRKKTLLGSLYKTFFSLLLKKSLLLKMSC